MRSLVAAVMCVITILVYLLIRRFKKKFPASKGAMASAHLGERSTAKYLGIRSQDPIIDKVEASKVFQ